MRILIFGILILPLRNSTACSEVTANFVNASTEAGIKTIAWCGRPERNHLLESGGSGIAFLDYDDDGWLDIYVVSAWKIEGETVTLKGRNALYRNRRDGTFEDVSAKAGVDDDGWGCGVCAGDYDGDGHLDIYVTNFGPNRLYHNRGDGTFEEVSHRAGVDDPRWSAGCLFFDADGDGDQDLYVANQVECTMEEVLHAKRETRWRNTVDVMSGPIGLPGSQDIFYINNGDGTFRDATESAGLTDVGKYYGFGAVCGDYDEDGDIDFYIANDSTPNYLYRNEGNGTFMDIATFAGCALSRDGASQAGMGVTAGDYNNDGIPDFIVTNFAQDYSTVYEGTGDLFYEDVSEKAGLWAPTFDKLSWGVGLFDYDRDGRSDLYIANGHIYPQVDEAPELGEQYEQENLLLRGTSSGFVDASKQAGPGLRDRGASHGTAFGDYDNDGDVDILVSHIDKVPSLLRNDTKTDGHWLMVDARPAPGRLPEPGTTVKVRTGEVWQMRFISSCDSFCSVNDWRAHFGLGAATAADEIVVIFPGKKIVRQTNVKADQIIRISGDGIVANKTAQE